jgi:hypothetical protein
MPVDAHRFVNISALLDGLNGRIGAVWDVRETGLKPQTFISLFPELFTICIFAPLVIVR